MSTTDRLFVLSADDDDLALPVLESEEEARSIVSVDASPQGRGRQGEGGLDVAPIKALF